ncbi:MAG: pyridoxal phosphate-dependent aminotransferase [Planctomycetes bacterium]|nr:pyridoxal phosphate-dependent aminotransferase [Planctomycetota bacterium]
MRLSDRVLRLKESATMAVTGRAKALQASGVDVVSFGAGQPDFVTPRHIIQAAQKALDEGHTGYAVPPSGLPATKQAVCDKLRACNNLDYDPSQIIITVGGKEALFLAFLAMLNEGDEVILPAPYWVSFPEQISLAGGRPVVVHGEERHGFRITPGQLGDAITERTRAVVLNYPSNPTGHSYSPAQLRELADVLAGRDIIVVADEMYDQLIYGEHEHVSWATLSEETYGKTLTLNAVSKTYAMTGWRLGYAAGPTDLIKAMAKLQGQSTSGTVNFCQYGLIAALSGDQECVEEMRLEYDRRRHIMYAGLCALDGVSCVEPTGAFYCFPNVSATYARLGVRTSVEFAEKLLEEGHVAVVPGVAFGSDQYVRLSYAVNEERIREGLSRLGKFLSA